MAKEKIEIGDLVTDGLHRGRVLKILGRDRIMVAAKVGNGIMSRKYTKVLKKAAKIEDK